MAENGTFFSFAIWNVFVRVWQIKNCTSIYTELYIHTNSAREGGIYLIVQNKQWIKQKLTIFPVDYQNIDNHLYLLILLCHSNEHVIGAYRHFDFVAIIRNKYSFCLASAIEMIKSYSIKILMWYVSVLMAIDATDKSGLINAETCADIVLWIIGLNCVV